jgi:hypothetical protein
LTYRCSVTCPLIQMLIFYFVVCICYKSHSFYVPMNLIVKLVEVLSGNWKVRGSYLVDDTGYLTKNFKVILLPPSTLRKWWDSRLRLKCDGTLIEIRFRLSAKRTSPFKSAGASVQSTTGNRVVRISGSNAGYTVFWGSVKSTGYPLHSPVSPSLPLPCFTVCHHISAGLYPQSSYDHFLLLS